MKITLFNTKIFLHYAIRSNETFQNYVVNHLNRKRIENYGNVFTQNQKKIVVNLTFLALTILGKAEQIKIRKDKKRRLKASLLNIH